MADGDMNDDRLAAFDARLRALEARGSDASGVPIIGGALEPRQALEGPTMFPSEIRLQGFIARITGNAADGTNRWKYTFVEVEQTTAEYGGWTTLASGRAGTARNLIEDINSAAGVQGNGVDLGHLDTTDYTFALQPAPANVIVRMWEVPYGTMTEYWFQYENGVDGTCD